jgi:hypothetical protein
LNDPPRMPNGPNTLCRMCGAISNHVSGLCGEHRRDAWWSDAPGDRLYREWLRTRDQAKDRGATP